MESRIKGIQPTPNLSGETRTTITRSMAGGMVAMVFGTTYTALLITKGALGVAITIAGVIPLSYGIVALVSGRWRGAMVEIMTIASILISILLGGEISGAIKLPYMIPYQDWPQQYSD